VFRRSCGASTCQISRSGSFGSTERPGRSDPAVAANQHRLSAPAWRLCVPHRHVREGAQIGKRAPGRSRRCSGRQRTTANRDGRPEAPLSDGTGTRTETRAKRCPPPWIRKRASSQVRAVAVGFEPTNGLPRYTLSRRAGGLATVGAGSDRLRHRQWPSHGRGRPGRPRQPADRPHRIPEVDLTGPRSATGHRWLSGDGFGLRHLETIRVK
jgi:hypothetical protein